MPDAEPVIALLRSVNIGGRRVAMADLREAVSAAGGIHTRTYVQSGNVVVVPPAAAHDAPGAWLSEVIGAAAGFAVDVVTRSLDELRTVVAANPYPEAGGPRLHVTFYASPPAADPLHGLDLGEFAPEHATFTGRELYMHLPTGIGRSPLAAGLHRTGRGRPAPLTTTRNWSTVLALVELAGS